MKNYLLSIYQPQGPAPEPETMRKIMAELDVLRRELESTGSWVFGDGLHDPATATVLRPTGGEVLMTDGPFAEGKEHLGGFVIVRAPDLDAALEWGRRYAQATTLPIEVRPFATEAGG
ncbi:YciI family protein [Herbidospora mongoliensis]|uniref:YciI family protein n=1 Tax=Herbidospora mongoliensis TaxID=688067 RepID=UPI0009FEFEAD|nr:YciI family protein [Herbidospora mongoliensis]